MINTSPVPIVRSGRLSALREGSRSIAMSMAAYRLSLLVVIGMVLAIAPPGADATPISVHSVVWLQTFRPFANSSLRREEDGPLKESVTLGDSPFPGVGRASITTGETVGFGGGPLPGSAFAAHARAEAAAHGTVLPNGEGVGTGVTSWVSSVISTEVQLVEVLPPLVPPDILPFLSVPVVLTALVSVSVQADNRLDSANAAAHVAFRDGFPIAIETVLATGRDDDEYPGTDEITVTEASEFLVFPGTVIPLEAIAVVSATAVASPPGVPTGQASATATADPVFSFNQQAFDEIMRGLGIPTFNLVDHYRFAFSPLLGEPPSGPGPTPVRAPWTLTLTSFGAGALVLLRSFCRWCSS